MKTSLTRLSTSCIVLLFACQVSAQVDTMLAESIPFDLRQKELLERLYLPGTEVTEEYMTREGVLLETEVALNMRTLVAERPVKYTDWANMKDRFHEHYKVLDSADELVRLDADRVLVQRDEIEDAVKGFKRTLFSAPMVVIDYGLTTDVLPQFTICITLTRMKAQRMSGVESYKFDPDQGPVSDHYTVSATGELNSITDAAYVTWKANERTRYMNRMRYAENGMGFGPLLGSVDEVGEGDVGHTQRDAFPWDLEVELLLEGNTPVGDPDKVATHLVFSCMSTDGVDDDRVKYRHGLVLHTKGSGGDIVTDTGFTNDYQEKAANIGSMCPPKCKRWWVD